MKLTKPNSIKFVKLWHDAVLNDNLNTLNLIVEEDAEFHTPVYMKPRKGRKMIVTVLTAAKSNFQDFKYFREWASEDEKDFCLEFSANVDGKPIKGVDLIRINDAGKIVHMEVMMRPIKQIARFAELQAEAIPRIYAQLWPESKL
ncbi:hypothetical protein HDU97_010212 [Phlyctochytrium planicorne]|nr:hypothetical protein HDU97_010212 [Phlyctochytrium planicorne]